MNKEFVVHFLQQPWPRIVWANKKDCLVSIGQVLSHPNASQVSDHWLISDNQMKCKGFYRKLKLSQSLWQTCERELPSFSWLSRNLENLEMILRWFGLDRPIGFLLLSLTLVISFYYVFWILVLPFLPEDSLVVIQPFFPKETRLAVILPIISGTAFYTALVVYGYIVLRREWHIKLNINLLSLKRCFILLHFNHELVNIYQFLYCRVVLKGWLRHNPIESVVVLD